MLMNNIINYPTHLEKAKTNQIQEIDITQKDFYAYQIPYVTTILENIRNDDYYNMSVGEIDIKRMFNKNKFILMFTWSNPYETFLNIKPDWTITINNKIIDNSKILNKYKNAVFTIRNSELIYGEHFNYKELKNNRPKRLIVHSLVLNSDELGISFDELENITMNFHNNKNPKMQAWQINKIKKAKNQPILNTKDNKIKVKIASQYQFLFKDLPMFYKPLKNIEYTNFDIELNDLKQREKINNIANIKTSSFGKNILKFYSPTKYDNRFEELGNTIKEYNKFKNNLFSYERKPSLPMYTIEMDSNHFEKINKNLTVEDDVNPNNWIQSKKFYYNDFVEYDYKTEELVKTDKQVSSGLIIPYNFNGDFITHFNFYFDEGGKNNKKDFINLSINKNQNVPQSVLNYSNGQIKLSIRESDEFEKYEESPVNDNAYSFDLYDIEEYLKNESFNQDYLDKYLITNKSLYEE
ncbi:MHO_1580 family protein [Mycoplasmopsis lipofaciens]|uniref:MHO_1580 family protein n=1 Tax=Mycoplasmopsis lipofaciens TaxID=114884 RepID=UPI0004870154|nr:hypothetical protein [Mycoplasmopsis lipofaciens]